MSLFRKKCLDEHSCSIEQTKAKERDVANIMAIFADVVSKIPTTIKDKPTIEC